MKFIQMHSMGSDCTAPYNVEDYKAKTVGEFVDEMLKECSDMWGDIDVKLNGQLFSGRRLCEYKNGKTTPKDTDLLDLKIVKVISSGGWGRMDFDIWVINDVMRIAEQGDLYHLYVMDKDMWLDREAMKRLYNLLGKNLGVENAVIKDGKVFVFTDDEEGEDECLRCSFANGGCANECICLVCFPDIQQVGKRFKLL